MLTLPGVAGRRYSPNPPPLRAASSLLIPGQLAFRLTSFADQIAAAGTALLLGAAAMSNQQDPAAASAPFDSRAAVVSDRGSLPQGKPSEGERTIEVVAKRFSFEPARVEVTEGERIRLMVSSGDGVHGLEIKKFKVNKKVPRGGEPVA